MRPPNAEIRILSPMAWVAEERRRQEEKWGQQNHNCLRWLGILMEELGEVAREVEDGNYKFKDGTRTEEDWRCDLEFELIQVAAVAVAWAEAIRRGTGSERLPDCSCSACCSTRQRTGRNQ